MPCAPGRAAGREGAAFCGTCLPGSFSDSGVWCEPCPAGTTTLFPGTLSAGQCASGAVVEARLEGMFAEDVLTKKLVALPALGLRQPRGAGIWSELPDLYGMPAVGLGVACSLPLLGMALASPKAAPATS